MAKKAYIGVDGKARKIKKGYVGVENFVHRTLPNGYTQVEYIESSGTQYIDTGFKPSWNSRVVVDVSDIPSGNGMIFGCRNASSATAAQQFNIYRNSDGMRSDYFGTNATLSISNTTSRTVIDKNKNVVTMYGKTVTNTAVSSGTVGYNLFLFAVNNVGSANSYASCKLRSCQIYDNGTLVRDYVPCMNASGAVGLYDIVNSKFYGNAGSGTFAAGATHSSFAKKIKKAYIGIGGVARPCWSGGELAYYGTITSLSSARLLLAATTIGDYALFGGGMASGNTNGLATVDAYTKSLTRSTPTALDVARHTLASTSVGEYALFCGGESGTAKKNTVDTYNLSLTKGSTSLSVVKYASAATTVGDYALIGGGSSTNSTNGRVVNAFNKSLTRTVPTALTAAMTNVCATTVSNYAIFLGPSGSSTCNAYDSDLTQTKLSSLSITNRNYISATTVGNHALFGGGIANDNGSTVVDAIDNNLSHSLPTGLSKARGRIAATAVGKYGLFAGGEATGSVNSNVVDAYDEALVRTIPNTLKTSRYNMAATSIGEFALFGGGRNSAGSYTSYSTVSAYTVA